MNKQLTVQHLIHCKSHKICYFTKKDGEEIEQQQGFTFQRTF